MYGQRAGRVEIRRDTFSVPHILALDEHASGFGFGYPMAEDLSANEWIALYHRDPATIDEWRGEVEQAHYIILVEGAA